MIWEEDFNSLSVKEIKKEQNKSPLTVNTGLFAAEKPLVWAHPPSRFGGRELEKSQAHTEAGPSCIHRPEDMGLPVSGAQGHGHLREGEV